jgi:hypothetical protein
LPQTNEQYKVSTENTTTAKSRGVEMMLFNRPLAEIEESDLQTLIDNQVAEQKTIEYKQVLPSGTDKDKKEFLADVSSFANATGGDLLFGIEAQVGLPTNLTGIQLDDVDAQKLRLENMLRDGIDPKLPRVDIQTVALASKPGHYILILRVQKSWFVHRVIFKDHGHFYSRHSAGKYRLDVAELRTAFELSGTVAERMRDFRAERLSRISAGEETPALLNEQEAKLVLHLIPLSAFSSSVTLDLTSLNDTFQGRILDKGKLLEPVRVWDIEPSASMRFNLDGFVRSTRADYKAAATIGYTQVFRNGIIETVDMSILGIHAQNVAQLGSSLEPKSFNGERYERKLLEAVKRYLDLLKFLGVEPPLFIMLSFLGVKGYKIALQKTVHHIIEYTGEIDRNNLIIPEIMLENFAADLAQAMKPIFDTVWNAAGGIGSPNYNTEGKFKFDY